LPQPNNKKNDLPDKKSVRFSSKLKPKAPIEKTNFPRKKSQKNEQSDHNDGLINALHEVTQHHIEEIKAMGPLSDKDIPKLHDKWYATCHNIMQGMPLHMPKIHEISHEIPLIDPDKRYKHCLPKCPDSMKQELMEKMKTYTTAGWWEPIQTDQAAPMLCIPKKNGKLHMTVNF
jgi:hypothetical protein